MEKNKAEKELKLIQYLRIASNNKQLLRNLVLSFKQQLNH